MVLVTLQEATNHIKDYLEENFNNNKNISVTNISYLVQYGQIKRHTHNGKTMVDLDDLKSYYGEYYSKRKLKWKDALGDDLNWNLSFENLREKDTTKHVHRLHPYKGKFIPQLVDYFLNDRTDEFKKEVFFNKGDVILDPFMGSGTTLVQANELGMHSIGIDISEFNCLISRCKLQEYSFLYLNKAKSRIINIIDKFRFEKDIVAFEKELLYEMSKFNKKHFPNPDFKYQVKQGLIDEDKYGLEKETDFIPIYQNLINKYDIKLEPNGGSNFLDKWYLDNINKEIELIHNEILKEEDPTTRSLFQVVLSRTVRSTRATKHYDLATLKEPQYSTYYCSKHKKICKPIMTIKHKFKQYINDTIRRLEDYHDLRTNALFEIISNDARNVDIIDEVKKANKGLSSILGNKKIKGVFTSPPYVGNIDYHEQHAYAYELFAFDRKDELEIGPLYKGQGIEARNSYIEGISKVLTNCKRFMAEDFNMFIVANDKYGLYEKIAEKADMRVVDKYKRPVLNRTERDRNPYSEIIFHMKDNYLKPL